MSKHTYADSTLKSWTKDELIHQIRILERNLAVKQELVNNHHRIVWGDTIEEAADKWNRRADTDDP